MKLGAQLYTIKTYTQTVKDFEYSMSQIAHMGYKTVQLSAIGASITPEVAKEICDKYGLQIVITHNDANRILYDTEKLIRDHEIMNCKYIGLGGMPEKYRSGEWIHRFYDDYKEAVNKIKDAGMLFMYHNHQFEFEKYNGKFLMDYILSDFSKDELGVTLDTYWLQYAGVDVCEWLYKLKDRIPCVHLKDMEVVKNEVVMAPVLEGNMNFKKIIKTLEDTNCEYMLVEQDICRENPFTCLSKSYNNLVELGYR